MQTEKEIKAEIDRLCKTDEDNSYIDVMVTRETLEWVLGEMDELPA